MKRILVVLFALLSFFVITAKAADNTIVPTGDSAAALLSSLQESKGNASTASYVPASTSEGYPPSPVSNSLGEVLTYADRLRPTQVCMPKVLVQSASDTVNELTQLVISLRAQIESLKKQLSSGGVSQESCTPVVGTQCFPDATVSAAVAIIQQQTADIAELERKLGISH